jgi:5,6-dimethylbenzimidazole synthase
MNTPASGYAPEMKDAVYRVIHERRDMRHFLPLPIDAEVLCRLLDAAHAAPSVGLTQPWRLIRITERPLREQIHALVEQERQATAAVLDERGQEFLRLKVEGVLECGEVLVAAVQDGGTHEVFGRRLLRTEMDLASVACAIQNLWLAARAEGIGMGWVSMFDPQALAALLRIPEHVRPIAVLCIGHVAGFYPAPMLALECWRQPRPLSELVCENTWPQTQAP